MMGEDLNKILKTKCSDANMCALGYELWTDDLDELLELAKKENDFIICRKPLSHTEILSLIPHQKLKEHGIFVDETKLKVKASSIESPYTMFLGSSGDFIVDTDTNIIVVADKGCMRLKFVNAGFYSVKVFTKSEVLIDLCADCRVLVLNHTNNNVKVFKANANEGVCDIKQLKVV